MARACDNGVVGPCPRRTGLSNIIIPGTGSRRDGDVPVGTLIKLPCMYASMHAHSPGTERVSYNVFGKRNQTILDEVRRRNMIL